jgi:pimeloyl-ACP methyl ester carboxylesterase
LNIYQYWMIGEVIFIILFFSIILFMLRRSAKNKTGKTKPPETVIDKIWFYTKYLLRILGVGLGTLLALFLFIMIERNLLTLYTETAPAPSQVEVPADLGFEVEEVTFKSEDGITLAGWFTPPQNGATVILLHGYGGNRMGMIWHAQQLVNAGYGVLMYDERASGESTGEYRSYGWEDTRDVKAAIQFLNSRKAGENIGVMGCSTGASIAVYSAALYPEIDAAWGDGNSSVRAQDLPAPTNPLVAAIIAGNYTIDWMYTVKLGIKAPTPLVEVIHQINPRPLMLVGGGTPISFLGSEGELYTYRFARLAGPNAQAWVIPETTHCDGPIQRPEEYSQRMVSFFDEAFNIVR